jgi:hypothetical protein
MNRLSATMPGPSETADSFQRMRIGSAFGREPLEIMAEDLRYVRGEIERLERKCVERVRWETQREQERKALSSCWTFASVRVLRQLVEAPASDLHSPSDSQVLQRFQTLKQSWRRETQLFSLMGKKILHPCYQSIIGLGPPVVPILLRELRDEPDHWFWALQCITGENPVPQADAGRFEVMRSAWLEWGRRNGWIR